MLLLDFFRTLVWFIYFFGYMLLHMGDLKAAEAARSAEDWETVRNATDQHVMKWCSTLLKLAGARVTVTGKENIPEGHAVYVANHRSYYDIPLVLTSLDYPHGILAKASTEKIPLVHRWMDLLGCVYVQRDDVRASMRALNQATAWTKAGNSFTIFPEGTRNDGPEGTTIEFKAGAFRIATKAGVPIVPVVLHNARNLMENNHYLMHPSAIEVHILPAIDSSGMTKDELKELPDKVRALINADLEAAHETAD